MSLVGDITLSFAERVSRVNRKQADDLIEFSKSLSLASHSIDALQTRLETPIARATLAGIYQRHSSHCATLWDMFIEARQKWRTKGKDLHMVANVIQAAWVVLVRYLFVGRLISEALDDVATLNDAELDVSQWTRDMALPSSQFGFVLSCKSVLNISVSEKPIGVYTPNLLTQALMMFIEAIDRVGWSPSASVYLIALFCRYGLMLHAPLKEAQGFAGIYAAVSDDEKALLFDRKVALKDDFFMATHCMFFHLFYRHRAIQGLFDYGKQLDRPLNVVAVKEWHAWRTAYGHAALEQACRTVFMGGEINEQVADRYWEMVMSRFVYPGELEFYQIMHPNDDANDATSLLFKIRPNAYRLLQEYLNKTAVDVLHDYATQQKTHDVPTPASFADFTVSGYLNQAIQNPARHWALDRLALLAFEVAFDMDCTMARLKPLFTQHAYVDDCSLIYERTLPPLNTTVVKNFRSMMTREQQESKVPFFVACWRLYGVIDAQGELVFYSPHLLDALAIWMRLLFTQANLNLANLKGAWKALFAQAPLFEEDRRYGVAGR